MKAALPAPSPTVVPTAPGRLPMLGHLMQLARRPLDFLQELRPMGDLVKIYLGPRPAYVINDPGLTRRFLVTEAHSFDKGIIFEKARAIVGNGLATVSSGEYHLRQRRLIQPAFHRDQIAGYAELMSAQLVEKAESWQPGQVVSVPQEMRNLALTLVAKTLFSSHLGREAVDAVRHAGPIIQDGVLRRTLSPVRFLEKLPTPANRRFNKTIEHLWATIDQAITAYRAEGIDRGDLLSMLIQARDQDTGETMTDVQIRDEVITMTLAGSDTTGNGLSWSFYQLGQHPEVARRIAAEVDEVVGDRPVTFHDIAKLDYTNRVVMEVFRLYPFWGIMRRAVTEVTLNGVHLPPNTQVLTSPIAMHRDPSIYPDPLRLDPDRWLPDRVKEIPRNAFIPFGAGNRQCIGERFAWTEIMLAVATIVPRWELQPLPGHTVSEVVRVTVNPSALPMVAVRRTRVTP